MFKKIFGKFARQRVNLEGYSKGSITRATRNPSIFE